MAHLGRSAATLVLFAAFAILFAMLIQPAPAAEKLAQYQARLSASDHLNSKGKALSTPAQVIRQDRANYHRFNKRDFEDQSEDLFANAKNRAWLEMAVAASSLSSAEQTAIMAGTPTVEVTVFETSVQVRVLE